MITSEPFSDLLSPYPNMGWFAQEVIMTPGYSFEREFEPGLDLVLDGIERRLAAALGRPASLVELREVAGYLMGWALRTQQAA